MDGYVKDAVDGMEGKCAGRRPEPASFVGNKAISRKIIVCPGRMGIPEKETFKIFAEAFLFFDWF